MEQRQPWSQAGPSGLHTQLTRTITQPLHQSPSLGWPRRLRTLKSWSISRCVLCDLYRFEWGHRFGIRLAVRTHACSCFPPWHTVQADQEVIGWRTRTTLTSLWPSAVPSVNQPTHSLVARMSRPVTVYTPPTPIISRNTSSITPSFFVDFRRELQGGVILTGIAKAGTVARFVSGEL
jgi:hypothetical protein